MVDTAVLTTPPFVGPINRSGCDQSITKPWYTEPLPPIFVEEPDLPSQVALHTQLLRNNRVSQLDSSILVPLKKKARNYA